MDVSVIIVNYNVKYFLEQCILSIKEASREIETEIIVVDNNSTDNSVEYISEKFPKVKLISNKENLGFSKANNQGFRISTGEYLFVLNPDTLIAADTLIELCRYMKMNPKVGVCGPKILNRDGKFDNVSKRGIPTPWVAFSRLSGLSALFPNTKLFGSYDMLYIGDDQCAVVGSLVGAAMFLRREAYEATNGFDEDYFMYGEDIDLSYRIAKSGWEVHYAPVSSIIHFRGESTKRSKIDRNNTFYGAMHIFVEKHFKRGVFPMGHLMIDFGIMLAKLISRLKSLKSKLLFPLVDFSGFWSLLLLARILRYGTGSISHMVMTVITFQAFIWMFAIAGFGGYVNKRNAWNAVIAGILFGFFFNSSFIYFFSQFAYSRFAIIFGFVFGGLFALSWRFFLGRLRQSSLWSKLYTRRSLIVGAGFVGIQTIQKLKGKDATGYIPVGVIDPEENLIGNFVEGLPVIGSEQDINRIIDQEKIEEIIFAYDTLNFDKVLKVVNQLKTRSPVTFKVISPENAALMNGQIPLLAMEYVTQRSWLMSLKKASKIVFRKE
ncbi:glycosyltransferase [Calditrichota bacterium]